MKAHRLAALAAIILTAIGLTGCAVMTPLTPAQGLLVTATSYPHFQAAVNGELGSRSGESSAVTVLWVVTVGDASVERAARSAGIKRIATIDHNYLNVLGLFSRYATIVTGE